MAAQKALTPYQRLEQNIAMRAGDDRIAQILQDGGVDPSGEPREVLDRLRRLDIVTRNRIITDIQAADAGDPRADLQTGRLTEMMAVGERAWRDMMRDVERDARRLLDEAAPAARNALQAGDTNRYEELRGRIEADVEAMMDVVRAARNDVRGVMRASLQKTTEAFTTQERQQHINRASGQLQIPRVVTEASGIVAELERALVRLESGLKPRPDFAATIGAKPRPMPG